MSDIHTFETTVQYLIELSSLLQRQHAAAKIIVDEKVTNSVGVPSIMYDIFETSATGQIFPVFI